MSAASAQHPDVMSAAMSEFIDRREIPGVVAAVTDADRNLYTCSLGMASRRDAIAMAPDTVFRIASMTKLVTSIAVMMLVEDGKVGLDAPLSKYVPAYRQPGVLESFESDTGGYRTRQARDATVKELLSHTSGYGYWYLDHRLNQLVDNAPDMLRAPFLIDAPGERFHYGISTDVLAQLIEPVSGMPLEQFFAKRIFEPLGLRDTSFDMPTNTQRLASIFVRDGGQLTELESETQAPPARGGGGLYSTVDDYCRILRLLLNKGLVQGGRVLGEQACAQITKNQIGDLRAPVQTSVDPKHSNDFIFMNGTQQFGFSVAVESVQQLTGRPAGSASWAGILNTYFWVDFAHEFAAVVMMQMRPFADPWCVELYRSFERTLYDCLEQA